MKPERSSPFAICLGLALLTWVVFGQTLRHDFVNYDDGDYVYKNPQITPGFTLEGIRWAFSSHHAANWHPLTWLSHMADCELFALRAGGHHLTNVVLHSATAILLFLVLRSMTASIWRSAFVAAVFAIHPLRVESVAWVAERKDVLSGLFFVLTIGAYAHYAREPSRGRYALVLVLFALGLMCKPMLVTLPLVLLLLDYWPLQRRAILEKLPLFSLTAASVLVTLCAQRPALQSLTRIPMSLRVGNAVMSTSTYIGQMFWPAGLVPFYPIQPSRIVLTRVLPPLVVVLGITLAVFWLRRQRYLVIGWLWYLVMLVPVIGIVQVGSQAHADRYTYLPHIGVLIAITWGAAHLASRRRTLRWVCGGLAVLAIATLALAAHKQTAYWHDSETLWRRTLAVTPINPIAEQNLGQVMHEKGRTAEAIAHVERALRIDPRQPSLHSALGVILLEVGRPDESLFHLEHALELDRDDPDAHYNLANTLMALGRGGEAVSHYQRALERNPMDAQAMNNMAWVLATAPDAMTRDGKRAVELAEHADALLPNDTRIHATLAAAYAEAGQFDRAVSTAQRALEIATEEGNTGLADTIRTHLRAYESGSPWRATP